MSEKKNCCQICGAMENVDLSEADNGLTGNKGKGLQNLFHRPVRVRMNCGYCGKLCCDGCLEWVGSSLFSGRYLCTTCRTNQKK